MNRRTLLLGLMLGLALVVHLPDALAAADPSGTATGGIANVPAVEAGKPTLEEIGAAVGQTRVSLNFVWMLIAGFLVMFIASWSPIIAVSPPCTGCKDRSQRQCGGPDTRRGRRPGRSCRTGIFPWPAAAHM